MLVTHLINAIIIPRLLEDASFRMPELIMIKASPFINGYSLKKVDNEVHD